MGEVGLADVVFSEAGDTREAPSHGHAQPHLEQSEANDHITIGPDVVFEDCLVGEGTAVDADFDSVDRNLQDEGYGRRRCLRYREQHQADNHAFFVWPEIGPEWLDGILQVSARRVVSASKNRPRSITGDLASGRVRF